MADSRSVLSAVVRKDYAIMDSIDIQNMVTKLERAIVSVERVLNFDEPSPGSPMTHAHRHTLEAGITTMKALNHDYGRLYEKILDKERKALESLQSGHTNGAS